MKKTVLISVLVVHILLLLSFYGVNALGIAVLLMIPTTGLIYTLGRAHGEQSMSERTARMNIPCVFRG